MRKPPEAARALPPPSEPPPPRTDLGRAVDGFTAAQTLSAPDDPDLASRAAVITEASAGDVPRMAPALQRLRRLAETPVGDEALTSAWSRIRTAPRTFDDPEELSRLRTMVTEVNDKLASVDESLEVDPVGRVTRASWSDSGLRVETTHPASAPDVNSLSYRALTEHSRTAMSQLAALAFERAEDDLSDDEPLSAADLSAILGLAVDADELPAEAEEVASELVDELAESFGATPSAIRGAIRAGWTQLSGISDDPRTGPQNAARDALRGLHRPPALRGKIDTLPSSALEGGDGSDSITSITLPDGSVAVAARDSIAGQARHLTPGPLGDDGRPRWLSVRPRPVADHRLLDRRLSSAGTPTQTYVASELGDHPAVNPRDVLVFSLPDNAKMPRLAGEPEMLGRAEVSGPKFKFQRRDLNLGAEEARQLVRDHAFAILPAAARKSVEADGYEPTAATVTVDGEAQDMILVMGISPSTAEEVTRDRGRLAFSNEGIVVGAANEIEASVEVEGELVPIDIPAQSVDVTDQRSRGTARRVQVPADPSVDVAVVASALEAAGATDLELYVARDVEDWDEAHVEVASDGFVTTSSLSRGGDRTSPHGGRVFVRDASILPDQPASHEGHRSTPRGAVIGNRLTVPSEQGGMPIEYRDPTDVLSAKLGDQPAVAFGYTGKELVPIFNEQEVSMGPWTATISPNGEIRSTSDDVAPAVHLYQDLEAAGVPGTFKLRTDTGTYRFR